MKNYTTRLKKICMYLSILCLTSSHAFSMNINPNALNQLKPELKTVALYSATITLALSAGWYGGKLACDGIRYLTLGQPAENRITALEDEVVSLRAALAQAQEQKDPDTNEDKNE